MLVKVNDRIEILSSMLLSAERYALGRMTYIVKDTCDFIANNLHLLLREHKITMIKDIEDCKNYGWDVDKECWLELLETIKRDLEEEKQREKEAVKRTKQKEYQSQYYIRNKEKIAERKKKLYQQRKGCEQ